MNLRGLRLGALGLLAKAGPPGLRAALSGLASLSDQAHVVRAALPRLHRRMTRSPRRRAEARARHEAFVARAPGYRAALEGGPDPSGGAEVTEIAGLRWWVPPDVRKAGGFADRVLRTGWLPLAEILKARRWARGGIMLDIGANIGATAIPRVLLGDFECAYAAEPEPANYACLVRNVSVNDLRGWVLPDQVAIGDRNGEATLLVSRMMANHRLRPGPEGASTPDANRRGVLVPCLTLDSWTGTLGVDVDRVTFIKCDTQGWEGHILLGAPEILRRRHIVWQLEFWPRGLAKARFDLEEFYDILARHFSHFIDLRGPQALAPPRRCGDLRAATAYLGAHGKRFTELLVYNA
jgi:FkbM family methyltransferase